MGGCYVYWKGDINMNTTFLTEFIQWAFNKFYVSMEKTRNMGAVQNGDKSYTGARRPDFFLSKKMRLGDLLASVASLACISLRQYTNQCDSGQRLKNCFSSEEAE